MWWTRALLNKVNRANNVEVNIETHHITYNVSRDFNLEGHNITPNIINIILRSHVILLTSHFWLLK